MAKTAVIQTRVTPEIKSSVQKILDELNITMSEAISVYLTQITLHRGIPFELKIPNRITADTLKKSEEGKELHDVSGTDELFGELES